MKLTANFLFYANILYKHMNTFYIHEQIPSFSFEKTYTRLVRMVSGPMELSFAVDFPQIFLTQQSVSPLYIYTKYLENLSLYVRH